MHANKVDLIHYSNRLSSEALSSLKEKKCMC